MIQITRGEAYTEKGSKFFGFLACVENVMQFNDVMAEIKKEHRKTGKPCHHRGAILRRSFAWKRKLDSRICNGC